MSALAPTPETEAFTATPRSFWAGYYQSLELARTIERQRDEARQQRDLLSDTLETFRMRSRCHSPEIDAQAERLIAEHKERRGGEK